MENAAEPFGELSIEPTGQLPQSLQLSKHHTKYCTFECQETWGHNWIYLKWVKASIIHISFHSSFWCTYSDDWDCIPLDLLTTCIFHLISPLPEPKEKKKGMPKIKYGKVSSCTSCWDAVGFTPEQATLAFFLLLSFIRSPACHLCQLHFRTLAYLYVKGIWGDASVCHGWEQVEPSLWVGPTRAMHGSSTVANWASHAWGELHLSLSPARTPPPLYFTRGRYPHPFFRSLWAQVTLWQEDKPLSLRVRDSWLQNVWPTACQWLRLLNLIYYY